MCNFCFFLLNKKQPTHNQINQEVKVDTKPRVGTREQRQKENSVWLTCAYWVETPLSSSSLLVSEAKYICIPIRNPCFSSEKVFCFMIEGKLQFR